MMADIRHIGKIEKSEYLLNGLSDRHEIWQVTHFGLLDRSDG